MPATNAGRRYYTYPLSEEVSSALRRYLTFPGRIEWSGTMALLERSNWYELARSTNWTPQFVSEKELFPPVQSDPFDIPMSEWETYDEPFKVSYREYVALQREKDSGAYSVKAALSRSKFHETAYAGYLSILKWHYGSNALGEYAACFPAGRMVRFAKPPSMRNMCVFFALDELRHTQIELFHAHELVKLDRQFDWALKAHHTMNMAALPGRHAADDIMMTRDVVSSSIMINLAFETGITNVQMVAMSADAANIGDFSFAKSDYQRAVRRGAPRPDRNSACGDFSAERKKSGSPACH